MTSHPASTTITLTEDTVTLRRNVSYWKRKSVEESPAVNGQRGNVEKQVFDDVFTNNM